MTVKVVTDSDSEEGIEDIEVAKACDRIGRWLQFRFLRGLLIRELGWEIPDSYRKEA